MEENPCIKNKKPIVREKECDGKDGIISGDPIQEGYCVNQVCFDKKEIQDLRLTHVRYVPKEGESPHTDPAPIPGDFKGPLDRKIIKRADIVAAGIQSPTKDTYDEDYENRKKDYRYYKVAYLVKRAYKKYKEHKKQQPTIGVSPNQSTRRVSPNQSRIRFRDRLNNKIGPPSPRIISVSPVQPTIRVSPNQSTIRVYPNQSTRRGPSVQPTRRFPLLPMIRRPIHGKKELVQPTRRGPSVQPKIRFRDRLNNNIGIPSPHIISVSPVQPTRRFRDRLNNKIGTPSPKNKFHLEYEKTRNQRRANSIKNFHR